MSVLEHSVSERKKHVTEGSHLSGISSSYSSGPQDPITNPLIPNQWKKFPESGLLAGEGEHRSAHQEETSALCRLIKPQVCSVIHVGMETWFLLTPVKLKDLIAQQRGGTVGMSSPYPHPQWLPPSQGTK